VRWIEQYRDLLPLVEPRTGDRVELDINRRWVDVWAGHPTPPSYPGPGVVPCIASNTTRTEGRGPWPSVSSRRSSTAECPGCIVPTRRSTRRCAGGTGNRLTTCLSAWRLPSSLSVPLTGWPAPPDLLGRSVGEPRPGGGAGPGPQPPGTQRSYVSCLSLRVG